MSFLYRDLYTIDIPVVLSMKMRAEDQEECRAASGMEPEAALAFAVLNSVDVKVIVLDGEIVGVFGIGPSPYGGAPWMLATDDLFSKGLRGLFSKVSVDVVAGMLEKYQRLENYVAASNKKAIRWLDWLGFSFGKKIRLVDPNVEFVHFWKGDHASCAG